MTNEEAGMLVFKLIKNHSRYVLTVEELQMGFSGDADFSKGLTYVMKTKGWVEKKGSIIRLTRTGLEMARVVP